MDVVHDDFEEGCGYRGGECVVKNPLEQFVSVEERADGTYVKVSRSERDALQLDAVLRSMDNSIVMNFDPEKFKDVFTRARGVFEKIGPLFEYYDTEFDSYLSVTITNQRAAVKIPESLILKGKRPNDRQMLFFLKRKGVVHGIDMPALMQMLTGTVYDRYVDIAFATPPENGTDAQIDMKIKVSPDTKPKTRRDGSVDYRSIQTFTSVAKGELIAVKIPATSGRPGTTVTGEMIPSQSGNDTHLPNGRNTEVSADGMCLTASSTGIIFLESGVVNVVELLHINSDVDFSVGNIKYSGDVLISGSVMPGFVVEAEGSIQVKGGVESAKIISRNGNVVVDKGIMGKGDTFITAKKGISVAFAQDASFTTEGTVTLEKYLLHCTVICETFEGSNPQCSVIGGEIKAAKSIVLKCCGSEKEVPTRMVIYDKNKHLLDGKLTELAELRGKLTGEMAGVEKQLRTKAALLKKAGENVSDRNRDEIKKWVDTYNEMKKKITFVDTKVQELERAKDNPTDQNGFISVIDKCFVGSEVVLYENAQHIKHTLVGKRFVMKNKTIVIEG